jgi:hypothetical protein
MHDTGRYRYTVGQKCQESILYNVHVCGTVWWVAQGCFQYSNNSHSRVPSSPYLLWLLSSVGHSYL